MYYVYLHKDLQDQGKIVYVGHGSNARAWECSGNTRELPHKEWMLAQYKNTLTLPDFVQIYHTTLDKKEACSVERDLIYQLEPRFNILKSGGRSPLAKLNDRQVVEILSLLDQNITQSEIAVKFGIERTQVSNIKTGKRWSHLTGIKYVPTKLLINV